MASASDIYRLPWASSVITAIGATILPSADERRAVQGCTG